MANGMEGNKMILELIEVVENGGNIAAYREELLKILKSIQEPKKEIFDEPAVKITWVEPTEITATIKEPAGKVTVAEKSKKILKKVK